MSIKKKDNANAPEPTCDAQQNVTKNIKRFPIVGIGASAGGLAAFETFFSGMPADLDLGMAFVLVQHLSPDYKSALTDIIQGYTHMPVFEAEDGMKVMSNCIYVIPPNRDMAFLNGVLQLFELPTSRGQHLPIDFFFRSLAQDQHERAIGIVLSGTGSDGTLGVRAIKGEGGLVIVQEPGSTEHDGMLRSAIATGMVDYVLPIAEMPQKLIEYATYAFGKPSKTASVLPPKIDSALKKIYVLLRAKGGNDFSQYKTSTICRRIERRMSIHQIEHIDDYVKYLQQFPVEVEALFRDLLIGVTCFFRDPEAFKVLEQQGISELFVNKQAGDIIRVWVPCCSTGEEAYSIAILLKEYIDRVGHVYMVQIFATDIDSHAIITARAGIYPASIALDISQDRLKRFFIAESGGGAYRIHKSIRDMLIFSEQNVIKDPPFSRLDLISCRNFLIYLNKDLQKRIIDLFQYALSPDGLLFLGNSENVGESDNTFVALDYKSRLFQNEKDYSGVHYTNSGLFSPFLAATVSTARWPSEKDSYLVKMSMREIAEQALLQQQTLAGVLINRHGDIYYLHGRAGMYLELAPGEVGINNILKMAREGLRQELIAALHKAAEKKEIVRYPGLKVKMNSFFNFVNLSVHPVEVTNDVMHETPLYLVILEQTSQSEMVIIDQSSENGEQSLVGDIRIEELKQQLWAKEEYLQAAVEELETANEELCSSNEEMQSINEELQSTNEELETSREELQSINEELITVNAELQTKVSELSRFNNDMNNMLSGTGIATVFVDLQLSILRFTPAATEIINLIQSDIGRPIAHLASNLAGYDNLISDVQAVLHTLIYKEVEVQTKKGRWYLMRIRPYRTLENVIEGAVITFSDITEIKKMENMLAASESRFHRLFETAKDGILILNAESGKIEDVNQFLIDMLGYTREQLITKSIWDIGFLEDIISNKDKFLELQGKEYVRYDNLPLETADGRRINVEFISSVYTVNKNKIIQCAIREISKFE